MNRTILTSRPNHITHHKKRSAATPWWGDGVSYSMSSIPSEYVATLGTDFLKENYQNGLVVDFGVWNGRNIPLLLRVKGSLVGTETPDSAEMLRQTAARFPDLRFEVMPLTEIAFDTGSVGAALCWRVLHNLVQPGELSKAMQEFNRVLKNNAPLLVAVRFDSFRKESDDTRKCYIRSLPNGHAGVREAIYFTTEVLEKLATLFGFSAIKMGLVAEDEKVNDERVVNKYLVAHLIKTSEPAANSAKLAEKYFERTL